ncbi:MAG: 2-oxoacid:acceptor oxidoreductase subunit alpha [Calditrichaeota bacterium]|nr:MAG: 2-oxoacid:acceptor oxidoreductase subunit alpha [Calditrichota bacterium]
MKTAQQVTRVTIRFAGDSGDGIQLTGHQFTRTTAIAGNDISTLPDFPAEIRAPAGTLYGVSGFQLQFSSESIHTPGDQADVLVAMNPAALKRSLKYLKKGGIIIVNTDAFTPRNLRLAHFESNPLEDGELQGYQVFPVAMSQLTRAALEGVELTHKEKERCKNFFALGILYWLYNRPLQPTIDWIARKFAGKPIWVEANTLALKAGYNYAESTEIFTSCFEVPPAKIEPGIYRHITGNEALCFGLIAAGEKAGRNIFYASYPITPASDVLQYMALYKNFGVKSFQAEDEIAAIGSAIGASFGGDIGVTATSGPGLALKTEFIGFGVIAEIPLVILNIQRAGPSTGMPTKTEQADLLQALFGRSGEAPIPVIAAQSPADCFWAAFEAVQVATRFMTPVLVLSDAYLANGAEPWKIPDVDQLPTIEIEFAREGEPYFPYQRDEVTLARRWAVPGTPGLEHRIGGLEKEDVTGNVSYDPDNHHKMVTLRAEKIQRVRDHVTEPEIYGDPQGDLLIVSWGSTYGAVLTAVDELRNEGKSVSFYHLRWINPLPRKLEQYIHNFKRVLVPEVNMGQLRRLIRDAYLVDAVGFNRVKGQPLSVSELKATIDRMLEEK